MQISIKDILGMRLILLGSEQQAVNQDRAPARSLRLPYVMVRRSGCGEFARITQRLAGR